MAFGNRGKWDMGKGGNRRRKAIGGERLSEKRGIKEKSGGRLDKNCDKIG